VGVFTRSERVPLPPPSSEEAAPVEITSRRRWARRLGTVLIVLGVIGLAYGAAIYFWRDPVTDLYTRVQQHRLQGQLTKSVEEFQTAIAFPEASPAAPQDLSSEDLAEAVQRVAGTMLAGLEEGDALGRLTIPRLGIHPIVVNGTRWAQDLSRGPGRYPETSLPGMGEVTAIAGHRTTFGAPFRKIDELRAGDPITLALPYGTFEYRVFSHEIVDDADWSVIRGRGFDTLVLSACHPLYSASQRWIVYARLVSVELPNGRSYEVGAGS
jgi:sortase A